MRSLLLAIQFFTRIPLPHAVAERIGFSQQAMQVAMGHWPAVGWLVGLAAAFAWQCSVWLWGTSALWMVSPSMLMALAVLISMGSSVALTGAMHEDGLADVADALGGHLPAQRALEVMKDSSVGSYAALTLILAVLGKWVLLTTLGLLHSGLMLCVLLAAHVVSRAAPLWLAHTLPYVGLHGQSKTLQAAGSLQQLPITPALLWCAPLLGIYFLPDGAWLLTVVAGATVVAWLLCLPLLRAWFKRRLGGITGDCLGASQQICELVVYAAALALCAHTIA